MDKKCLRLSLEQETTHSTWEEDDEEVESLREN
jgi:hypothetical protein